MAVGSPNKREVVELVTACSVQAEEVVSMAWEVGGGWLLVQLEWLIR